MSTSSPIFIPVTRTPFPGGQSGNGYYVNIAIPGGSIHEVLVDTGSCGLVIPAALLYVGGTLNPDAPGPLLPGIKQLGPITIPYQPSSEDLTGFIYEIEAINIGVAANSTSAYTAQNVQIVGVMNAKKPGFGMMGVGFGRPTPFATNLLLSAGPNVYPSYLFNQQGITLGYTPATLPGKYQFQALQPTTTAGDWMTPSAIISLGDGSSPFFGTALLDTGINSMMLGLPDIGWQQGAANQPLTIGWAASLNAPSILSYTFQIGTQELPGEEGSRPAFSVSGPTPALPSELLPIGQAPQAAFVNTGINVLQIASLFYDSQVGQIGFCQY